MLSERLSLSLEECQETTSSSDFQLWMTYIREEVNYFHREDWYFAAILAFLHNMFLPEGKLPYKEEDFLFKFTPRDEDPRDVVKEKTPEEEQAELKRRIAVSKAAWFGSMGLKPDGTPIKGMRKKKGTLKERYPNIRLGKDDKK